MESDREVYLQSQLRSNLITVRDFIRGLFLSDRFRRGYIECNDNYRLTEHVIAKALERKIYNATESLALSTIIAEKGFNYFIDYILESDEYMRRFGYDIAPRELHVFYRVRQQAQYHYTNNTQDTDLIGKKTNNK